MFVPMLQQVGSGAAKDYSGNANDIALGSGAADNSTASVGVWSDTSRELNAYMLVQADGLSSTKHMYVPNLTAPWDLSEWMMFFMDIKPTAGSTARAIVRCGQSGLTAGWSIQDNGSGKVRILIYTAAGAATAADLTSTKTLLVTAKTVRLMVAIDPATGNVYLFANGHLEDTFLAAYSGSGTASRLLTFGTTAAASGTTSMSNMYGALFGPVHYYKGTGTLPSNYTSLARRLADMPTVPLSEFELPA